mmetsp:Transcript_6470/g.12174  ORF Transcript_6470/g.12174 Transcript_6470/m.12174 type:complete len:436 (+) Transcript_6470:5-1312(+)
MGRREKRRKKKAAQRKANRHQYRSTKREKKAYVPHSMCQNLGDEKGEPRSNRVEGTILIVGDGDFSFTRGLIRSRPRRNGSGILATSYDHGIAVAEKYPNAAGIIREIEKCKAVVMHGIDCRRLHEGKLAGRKFSRIIFNFPHSGQQRVHINQALLRDFFASAKNALEKGGEVHVTLRDKPPYSNWKIEEQAAKSGFRVRETRMFNEKMFPGYHHRTTLKDAEVFDSRFCRTRIFYMAARKRDSGNHAASSQVDEPVAKRHRQKSEEVDLKSAKPTSASKKRPAVEVQDQSAEKRQRQRKGGRDDHIGSRSLESEDEDEDDEDEEDANSDAIFDVFGWGKQEKIKIGSPRKSCSPPGWLQDKSLRKKPSSQDKKKKKRRRRSLAEKENRAESDPKRKRREKLSRKLHLDDEESKMCGSRALISHLKKLRLKRRRS